MQLTRQLSRNFSGLDNIESAGMHYPNLRGLRHRCEAFPLFRHARIEPRKVISRAVPHDAREHMHPARDEVKPFTDYGIDHMWSAVESAVAASLCRRTSKTISCRDRLNNRTG